jgi:hypothetical protein
MVHDFCLASFVTTGRRYSPAVPLLTDRVGPCGRDRPRGRSEKSPPSPTLASDPIPPKHSSRRRLGSPRVVVLGYCRRRELAPPRPTAYTPGPQTSRGSGVGKPSSRCRGW